MASRHREPRKTFNSPSKVSTISQRLVFVLNSPFLIYCEVKLVDTERELQRLYSILFSADWWWLLVLGAKGSVRRQPGKVHCIYERRYTSLDAPAFVVD